MREAHASFFKGIFNIHPPLYIYSNCNKTEQKEREREGGFLRKEREKTIEINCYWGQRVVCWISTTPQNLERPIYTCSNGSTTLSLLVNFLFIFTMCNWFCNLLKMSHVPFTCTLRPNLSGKCTKGLI